MRKLLLFVLFLTNLHLSHAATWTIGPTGNFTDFNAAMSSGSVKDGDVLRVPAGVTVGSTSASQTITKRVTIEGQGYARNDAGQIQNKATAISLVLQQDGIVVTKMCLENTVVIRANDITIEKCFVDAEIQANRRNYDSDNLTVRQCEVTKLIRGLNDEDQQGCRKWRTKTIGNRL